MNFLSNKHFLKNGGLNLVWLLALTWPLLSIPGQTADNSKLNKEQKTEIPHRLTKAQIEAAIQQARKHDEEERSKQPFSIKLFLIDPNGDTVKNAKVKVVGSSTMSDGILMSSTPGGFPSESIAKSAGQIVITTDRPQTRLAAVEITAPEFAPLRKLNLKTGSSYVLRMQPGLTVQGRIIKEGQALKGIKMVLESLIRDEALFGRTKPRATFQTETDESGAFTFSELSPDESYLLYGKGSSFRGIGYLPDISIASESKKQIVNLGDLEVLPGFTLKGKLVMKNSSPLHDNVSLRVSTERDINGRFIKVAPDGAFQVKGLPLGACQIRLVKANFRLVPNRTDATKPDYQEINLNSDMKDLKLLIESIPDNERLPH